MSTRKTKAMLEEENAELQRQIQEAKRQQTQIPVTVGAEPDSGSHAIDHLTLMDNHEAPDTNKEPVEDIDVRARADLSFWNNSWTWAEAANSFGDKPEDKWFVNPTPKLIAEVMNNAPTVFSACEVALIAGDHKVQFEEERDRHLHYLRGAQAGDLVSEALDLMTAYQSRYFETVQRYLGLCSSYQNVLNNNNATEDQVENAQLRKEAAGAQCRAWTAKLIALVEAYHDVVSDDRAYNLSYNFSPLPPEDGKPASREYSLYRWSVTNTLNKVGRRLARSIKEGKLDAEKYRVPRPWLTEERKGRQLDANQMLSDFA